MSSRGLVGVKMLIRDIAALLLLLILYWAFSSLYSFPQVLSARPFITLGDVIRAILVLVAIFILYALMDPLTMLYSATFRRRYRLAVSITSKLITIAVLAVAYFGFKSILVNVLCLLTARSTAAKIYDVAFLIAVVLVVYGIIKELTKLPGET